MLQKLDTLYPFHTIKYVFLSYFTRYSSRLIFYFPVFIMFHGYIIEMFHIFTHNILGNNVSRETLSCINLFYIITMFHVKHCSPFHLHLVFYHTYCQNSKITYLYLQISNQIALSYPTFKNITIIFLFITNIIFTKD